MNVFETIIEKAVRDPRRIALAEGADPRVIKAAIRAQQDGVARPVLIGKRRQIEARLQVECADASSYDIVDPSDPEHTARYTEAYHELRKHKGVDLEKAAIAIRQPLNFAALMVRLGDAEGCIGGAVETTAATVRAALQIIGVAPGVKTVSSFFLLFHENGTTKDTTPLMFSDCALVIKPTAEQLADIACSAADSYQSLIGETPLTALLSFSTAGSGTHETVTVIRNGFELAKQARPELIIDGEMQFDAAFVESVAYRKAPQSPLQGAANVFIFPNLDAGNIGYKVAQRLGNMKAIGPILQGLNQPANDLSRGCSAEDVYALLAVTSVQANSR